MAPTFGRVGVGVAPDSPRPNVGAAEPWEAKRAASAALSQALAIAFCIGDLSRMATRRILDAEHHAQFVTFSCFRRRRLLDHPRMRACFVKITSEKLHKHAGVCCGFVVMPDHVHAIVWFAAAGALSAFMKSWKQTTSLRLKRVLRGVAPHYASSLAPDEAFWQAKYYPFNLYSGRKAREKLDNMHLNPVRAGLVARAVDWRWSWAAFYEGGVDVGIPVEWIFEP